MGKLIDDLLEYSRLGRREPIFSVVNMKVLVEKVIEEVSNYYPNINAEISVAELPYANADTSLLKQLLFNLISNAFKYSQKKKFLKLKSDRIKTEKKPFSLLKTTEPDSI